MPRHHGAELSVLQLDRRGLPQRGEELSSAPYGQARHRQQHLVELREPRRSKQLGQTAPRQTEARLEPAQRRPRRRKRLQRAEHTLFGILQGPKHRQVLPACRRAQGAHHVCIEQVVVDNQ